jgi:hypothetical protein
MNMFSRKPAAEPEITGTQALRDHLQSRTSGPNGTSLARVASEINDALNDIASRAAARNVAARMAPDADEAALRSLAASLNLTTAASTIVTGQQLNNFISGRDLDTAVKDQLARYLHGGNVVFDAETNRLESAYQHNPQVMGWAPEPYTNPNADIARAQAALKEAQLKARRPTPQRQPLPPPQQRSKARPGFA